MGKNDTVVYGSEAQMGYFRRRAGKGFIYLDEHKSKIKDTVIIERIKNLKIPPMWEEVSISTNENTHLQATGKDQKGRKQYLYHPQWMSYRNECKFRRMTEFGRALPIIRKQSLADMQLHGWPKKKVLGLVVQILNEAYIRIGNIYYKEENETYGLTTLRRKHLKIEGSKISFQYKAKSGKYRNIGIKNIRLRRLIKACSELPGHEIFRFLDEEDKKWHSIDSHDVNEYLKSISGEQFSSKDFRTWGGSVTAIEKFEKAREQARATNKKTMIPTLIKMVAQKLGNTVAICRDYYIHPAILEAIESETLTKYSQDLQNQSSQAGDLSPHEIVALDIIETYEKKRGKLQASNL